MIKVYSYDSMNGEHDLYICDLDDGYCLRFCIMDGSLIVYKVDVFLITAYHTDITSDLISNFSYYEIENQFQSARKWFKDIFEEEKESPVKIFFIINNPNDLVIRSADFDSGRYVIFDSDGGKDFEVNLTRSPF